MEARSESSEQGRIRGGSITLRSTVSCQVYCGHRSEAPSCVELGVLHRRGDSTVLESAVATTREKIVERYAYFKNGIFLTSFVTGDPNADDEPSVRLILSRSIASI